MQAALKANWWRMLRAALLLVAIGIGVAVTVTVSSGPHFIAGALTQLLGRRVEIAGLELRLGRALEIELTGVRAFAADSTDGDPMLEVPRARGRQSWPRLLAGQFVPLEWTLEQPLLRLPLTGERQAGIQLQPRLPLLKLTIQDGTVEWRAGQGEPVLLEGIQLLAQRSAVLGSLVGSLTAEVSRGGDPLGRVALDFRGLTQGVALEGELRALELAALPLPDLLPDLPISSGRVDGRIALQIEEEGIEGAVDFIITDFHMDLPQLSGPIAPSEMRLRGEGSWRNGELSLYPHAIRLDDLALTGSLHLRPGPRGRVRGRLVLDPFRFGRAGGRLQLIRLLGLRHQTWKGVDERAEDGWIDDLEVNFDLPLDGLDEALAFRRKLRPEELTLVARFRDGVYRPYPDAAPLEHIVGELRVIGNVLELDGLRMTRSGHPLPSINLRVDGMHRLAHLPRAERNPPPGPGEPIPGLGPAFTALAEGQTGDGKAPVFRLSNFRIGYTAFLLPIRNLNGRLSFPKGGVVIEDATCVVGGAPARLRAGWDRRTNRVSADITYEDGNAPPPTADDGSWIEGRFESESVSFGTWLVESVAGRLRARGAQVQFTEVEGQLGHGDLQAHGSVSLAEPSGAPFRFEIDIKGADADILRGYLQLEEGTVTGRAFARGELSGRLEPGRRFLEQAEVDLLTRLEDGTLERLPATIALARLPSLQGVRALFGQPLPYDTISARFRIQAGVLHTENFSLQGPELRMLAAGDIDLLSEDLQADMTVALLFLQTVDWLIEKLPILRDLVLGKDRNLVALYFRLEGPWEDPKARLVTPAAIQAPTDWAARIIGSGVERLIDLFSIGESRAKSQTDDDAGQTQDQ